MQSTPNSVSSQNTDVYQAPQSELSMIYNAAGIDKTKPWDPAGRFGRLSYMAWLCVLAVVTSVALLLVLFLGGVFGILMSSKISSNPSNFVSGMGAFTILFVFIIYIANVIFVAIFSIRRLHDLNKSGHWLWTILIPVVNIIFMLVGFCFLYFIRGTQGANQFGPVRITPKWERVVGYICIALTVIQILIFSVILAGLASVGGSVANLH